MLSFGLHGHLGDSKERNERKKSHLQKKKENFEKHEAFVENKFRLGRSVKQY